MALVADFTILVTGQRMVPERTSGTSPLIIPFWTDIDNGGAVIFNFRYRGLRRAVAEVFVNDEKVTDLQPYPRANESDWYASTFVTRPGLVRQSPNRIRFDAAPDEVYFVDNLYCLFKQDA